MTVIARRSRTNAVSRTTESLPKLASLLDVPLVCLVDRLPHRVDVLRIEESGEVGDRPPAGEAVDSLQGRASRRGVMGEESGLDSLIRSDFFEKSVVHGTGGKAIPVRQASHNI